ncbi:MAG: hypothetical protein Q7W54_15310, partial [Bacteroidota bacterium]|nr:hypothetical protein [Bacteroidota bacterium]
VRANTKFSIKQLETLEYCKIARSREEILYFLGLSNQTKNYAKYVQPLLDAQLLEYTKPEKANVKGQQYVLTTFGRELVEK